MGWLKYSKFFEMIAYGISTLIPVFWRESLGLGEAEIGRIMAAAFVISVCAPIFFGKMGSAYSPEKPIGFSYLLYIVCCLALFLFPKAELQLLIYCLLVFAQWGFMTLVPVGVLHSISKSPGAMYGSYRRVGSLGFLIGLWGIGYLMDAWKPEVILIVMALATILALHPFLKRIHIPKSNFSTEGYRTILSRPLMRNFYLAVLFISTYFAFTFIYMSLRMVELGASNTLVAWNMSLCGVTAMLSLRAVGGIVDRLPLGPLYLSVPVFAFFRLFCLSLPETNPNWFLLIQMLHIPTWVLHDIILFKFIHRYCSKQEFPQAQGLVQVSISLGVALGSWVGAFFVQHWGLQSAFLFCSPLPLLGLIFLWRVCRLINDEKKLTSPTAFSDSKECEL